MSNTVEIVTDEMMTAGMDCLQRYGCKRDPHIAAAVYNAMWTAEQMPALPSIGTAGMDCLQRHGCKPDLHIAFDLYNAMWTAKQRPARAAASAKELEIAAAALPSIGGSSGPEQSKALSAFIVATIKDARVRGEL